MTKLNTSQTARDFIKIAKTVSEITETGEEFPTGNYIYPEPLAGETTETRAEHVTCKEDPVRVAHNTAVNG